MDHCDHHYARAVRQGRTVLEAQTASPSVVVLVKHP